MKRTLPLVVGLAAFAMACSDPTMPNRALIGDVSAAITPHPINFGGGGTFPADPAGGNLITYGAVVLCKTGDAAGSFDFTMTVNGGASQAIPGGPLVLTGAGDTDCRTIYTSTVNNAATPDLITVTETGQTDWALTGVDIDQYFGQFVVYPTPRLDSDADDSPTDGATVYINNDMAKVITFTNDFTPPPGNEGCTPGYWKNHSDSWPATGYSPAQILESVFDVPDGLGLDNATLLQALSFTGGPGTLGGAKILLRAAVAALLNAAHPGVDYGMTEAEIIAAVNAALASADRDEMLDLAGDLDELNNAGCPIN